MSIPAGLADFQRHYQISPIIFVNGIAEMYPGALLPIITFTQGSDFVNVQQAPQIAFEDYFATFQPVPGGTLIDNDIGMYPFANQAVAANAIITKPLAVSILMTCPVKTEGGYAQKRNILGDLQTRISSHIAAGGTFNVATPNFLYTNCILQRLQDVTSAETRQVQVEWQWDFIQPLLTNEQAQAAQGLLMQKLGPNGVRVDGDPPSPSGAAVGVGSSSTLQGQSTVPAAQNLAGASAGGVRQ